MNQAVLSISRALMLSVAVAVASSASPQTQTLPNTPPPAPAPGPQPIAQTAATLPMSLSSATSTALQQASAYGQAQIDEAIAAEELRASRAALLPRARDAFTVIYNSPSRDDPAVQSFIAQNSIHEYQNLIGVTGEWNFGLMSAVRRSRALLQAAHAGTEIARRALIRGITEAYYGGALATAKRIAAEQSLAAAEEFQRVTELNFKGGEVPEVDVIRARLQTAARRDDLLQAREAEAVANASLGTLLGLGTVRVPSIEPLPQTPDTTEIASITAAGVARRPEFAQLEAQSRAAREDVAGARTEYLPSITYSLDKGFDSESLHDLAQHRGTLATANIDVPIFDWGATRSRLRQAQLRARSVELQRQMTTRDLYLQFLTAQQEAAAAAQRVANARSALADAEKNLTISIARYRAGEAPITEATDAQTTAANQRLALQQALADFQIARAHLREAAGE